MNFNTVTKLLLIWLFFLFFGCCNKEDTNSGAIVSNLDIGNLDDFTQMDCYSYLDTLCILNDSTYQAAFTLNSPSSKCKAVLKPNVDFEKYSILIYRKLEGGNLVFHRHVAIDTINKLVTYRISTDNCFCADKCETESFNIVLIPKIGKDYKVEYK
jgi:hypothetical protein